MIETLTARSPIGLADLALRHKLGLVLLAVLYAIPFITPDTPTWILRISGLVSLLYLMMFAMSWDVVSGYTGEISFGHGFFFAIGGYTTAVLNVDHGIDPLASILVAVLLSAVGGIIIGVPALRLKGPYLSLVTLIVPVILLQLFVLFRGTFRGREGFTKSPHSLVGTTQDAVVTVGDFTTMIVANYYLALVLFTIILAVLIAVTRSDAGSIFTAIREDTQAVEAAGINPATFKIYAFVLSGTVGGLAAAVFVHSPVGHPQPSQLIDIQVSINVIIMSVIGGMGTIVGAVVGAVFFALVNTLFSSSDLVVPFVGIPIDQLFPIPLLAVTVLVLFFTPRGLLGGAISLGDRILHLRVASTDDVASDGGQPAGRTPLVRTVERYRAILREDARRLVDRLWRDDDE